MRTGRRTSAGSALFPFLVMLRVERYAAPEVRDTPGIRRLSLPFEIRQKSRFRAILEDGSEVAIFLPRGSNLADGDVLEADDGTLIRIVAASEQVLYVTASSSHALTRAAYHLGNRHTPVELGNGFLKLENDSVIKEMLLRLGVQVQEAHLPFQPEAGAYGGGHRHDSDPGGERQQAQELFHAHYGPSHPADESVPMAHKKNEPHAPEHS
jgi:urease accessory protein